MFRILFIDKVHPLLPGLLSDHGCVCEFMTGQTLAEVYQRAATCDGLVVRSRFQIDRAFIDACPGLRFIARVGAGTDNIDTIYAEERGIVCLNAPEGNRDAVGEHTVGLLIGLMSKVIRADRQVHSGIWRREENRGTEIMGKVIGIIGYGNMGSAFAGRLKGFGTEVIAYDKYKYGYSDDNTRETTMEELFERADIISLHVPLTEETFHLVNDKFLDSFARPVNIINTSRGGVVDTAALVRALKSHKVAGAALDVLEAENSEFEQSFSGSQEELMYLLNSDNVVITPHIAGWTMESEIKLAQVLAEKIIALSLRHK